ncbi:hypothetical protein [Streptomyces sp. FH025]|uniref:phage tail tube protein n=1 Tax=Streptomyces sp. FH025 TaxID=2815937 RepID=UPI001A9D63A6|nr:hypothetical protein [Streptomyces sp. FH025]MBO1414461.1 hypothetical protein [Streptomyces sp. FH025]
MAADDAPVLVPGTGYIYVAPPGTPLPDLKAGFDPKDSTKWGPEGLTWKSIGNTSLDNGIEMSVDGDEPEVLGSWQNKSLKTTDPGKTYAVTINLSDFTAESYKLYYGTDKGLDSKGLFSIPASPTAQNRALMIAAVDGTKCVAWHYPKSSIIGADSVTMDPAALGEMPVKATVVALNQSTPLGSVTPVFDLAAGLPAPAA